ncbi:hypothetical protein [Halomonas maura]|uniref:hypothetical protein n=1 Tax=Halomonas maura TaxID=117606 RepID=UPI0025B5B303|nr:hypothetical protein [Halomonas maura]MDN3554553.1 hypothetical protein [Halomonas maura]
MGQIALGKLVLDPLAVLGGLLPMPQLAPQLLSGALLFACAPMNSVYPLFGQRFGLGDITAATLMVGTLAAFLTIGLVLWLIHHAGVFVTP